MYNRQVWLLQRKETCIKLEKQIAGLLNMMLRLWLVQSTDPATVKSKTSLTRGRITKQQTHTHTDDGLCSAGVAGRCDAAAARSWRVMALESAEAVAVTVRFC